LLNKTKKVGEWAKIRNEIAGGRQQWQGLKFSLTPCLVPTLRRKSYIVRHYRYYFSGHLKKRISGFIKAD